MRLLSFDALRTLHFPSHQVIKPEHMLKYQQDIAAADWVLYPPYWLINSLVFGLNAKIFPNLPTYLLGHNKVEMTRAFELVTPAHTPHALIRANTPENAAEIWDTVPLPIVVVGNDIVTGYWRMQSPYSFHNNISRGGEVVQGIIPAAAETLVKHLCQRLNINHAGFDIAMVGDYPYVLEFNRLFGTRGLAKSQPELAQSIVNYLRQELDRDKPTTPNSPKPRVAAIKPTNPVQMTRIQLNQIICRLPTAGH